MPGESFQYDFDLPADHPGGTFWYHPHIHGRAAEQVFRGLVGAIVVEGDLDRVPEVAAARERLFVLKDGTIDASGRVPVATMMDFMNGREGQLVTINGALAPRLAMRPGEVERWRIVNAGNARYYRLRLSGHTMQWIGSDGGPLSTPKAVDELLLPPGKRAEVLVQAGAPGVHRLSSLPYSRGGMMMGGMMGRSGSSATELTLAELVVQGESAAMDLPTRLAGAADPQFGEVAARRELVLSEAMGPGGMRFMIDGRVFGHERVDIRVRLDTNEEWTIRNATDMDHPFHLHTNPFQVVGADGRLAPSGAWEDTVNVPRGRSVTFRVRFRDFPGKAMYHCHILEHEDLGMMGVVEVA
ncbi:MAG: multicopper oxidase family protein [Chloroflexota bacterium]|nr:MAG: multicopper oxidase family protein [Chloroflexota bacterium]